mmetsp:Transcript_2007/g.7495  ORF Transcript_2007/g.7495 Transcript_2007/m.7495 type:complete len:86 (+) Transcript_2007:1962-2219(+)
MRHPVFSGRASIIAVRVHHERQAIGGNIGDIECKRCPIAEDLVAPAWSAMMQSLESAGRPSTGDRHQGMAKGLRGMETRSSGLAG